MVGTRMEPCLYTKEFEMIDVLDVYTSLIWTERYNKCGDFEFHCPPSMKRIQELVPECYLSLDGSETAMVIETIKIDTSIEEGNTLEVSGRSLDSILDRRIIWNQTSLDSSIETAVAKLLNENVINPTNVDRKIPGFVFIPSGDERMSEIKVDKQFTGDNLLEAIQAICSTNRVGYRLLFDPNNAEARFKFQLYLGEDRTDNQSKNVSVTFSPGFDNLIGSSYTESKKLAKNVAQVKGEGEGDERTTISVGIGTPAGLERREMYVDARDISRTKDSTDSSGNQGGYTKEEYENLLIERAREKLYEIGDEKSFSGESDVTDGIFVYGRDFFMGDLVQIMNEFEMTDTVRVTELIRSGDENGFTAYPTFTSTIEEKEEVE